MQKAIKILAVVLTSLVLLLVAAVIAIVAFINPNDYKAQISQKVQQYTGRQLILQGDLGWTFFPWLGLQINQAQLSNAPGFGDQPFASIQKAEINVALLPLLKGQLEFGKITLNGFELYLSKNASGVTNWQDLLAHSDEQKPAASDNAVAATTKSKNYFSSFALAGVDINEGHIIWQDQQAQRYYDISALQLHSRITKWDEPFTVNLSFTISSKQPELKQLQVALRTELQVTPNSLQLGQIKAQVDESTLTGDIAINDLSKKALTFNLNLDRINLNNYTGAKMASAQKKAEAKSAPTDANSAVLPVAILQGLNVQGRLQIGNLQLGKLNPTDIAVQLKAADGVITLNPIAAKIYQGTYQGSIKLDVSGTTPQIASTIDLQNIHAEPLFHDMSNVTHLDLRGVGNFNAQLTTQGNTRNALIKQLAGQGKLTFANGVLKGIDIPYWIEVGRALLNKELPPGPSGSQQTDFGNLTATFTIMNGMLKNDDLMLRSSNVDAKGAGTVDLVNQQIDYRLNASILRSNGQPDGTVIPLQISGPFSEVKIRPAVEELLKAQLKGKIGTELSKHLDDVGGQLNKALNSLFH